MVREAAFAVEIDEQIELLDTALIECPSLDELTAQIDQYPRFTGYTTDYLVTNRCQNAEADEVRDSEVCQQAAPPTTPPATTPAVIYLGETLDGRQVELTPSADLPFIDDAPAEIKKTVDVAIAEGCDGTFGRRDLWYTIFVETGSDAASVFARHAQNVAVLLNCDDRPLPDLNESSDESATAE